MIVLDEDALICDFAETYHILDYKALPLKLAGVLAVGLRDDSRIKMKMADAKAPSDILIGAIIADRLGVISWQISGDEKKAPPKSICQTFFDDDNSNGFNTVDEYEEYRRKLLKDYE